MAGSLQWSVKRGWGRAAWVRPQAWRAVAVAVALLMAASASAVTVTWDGSSSASWGTSANWTPASVPGSSLTGDVAQFDGLGNGNTTIALGTNSTHRLLKWMRFQTAGVAAYTFTSTGSLICIGNGGGITVEAAVTTDQLFSVQIRPEKGTTTYTNNGSGTLTFGSGFSTYWSPDSAGAKAVAVFAGTGDIVVSKVDDRDPAPGGHRTMAVQVNGPGRVTITGGGNYSQGTTLNGGTLVARHSSALGEAGVDLNGSAAGTALHLENDITIANNLDLAGDNAGSSQAVLRSGSGDNTFAGAIRLETGGSAHYVQVDSGSLTLNGDIFQQNGTGTRSLDLQGAGDGTINGRIYNGSADTFDLNKRGLGTWTLTNAANSYNGATTVYAGTLLVNGSITSDVTVAGGLLAGSGSILGDVDVQAGGTCSAGNTPGHLIVDGSYTHSGGTMLVDIGGLLQGTEYDWIEVVGTPGTATLGGIEVHLDPGFVPQPGDYFDILTATGGITGFDSATFDYSDAQGGPVWWSWIETLPDGREALRLQASPEPTSLTLLGLGGLALLRRRRRSRGRA
ncbi:MAG TPA: autotransporter-associated beta strand repeat-containing protein [Planctomycetota bacterium]|nr:autotransporter-associated beta strand repeat-containing protein [Planctomycetota bacterium]